MRRRMLAAVAIALVLALLIAIIVVRQIVFGGTPVVRHTTGQATPIACPSPVTAPGARVFAIVSQRSSAGYTAHFQAAGQTLPGVVKGVTGDVSGQFILVPAPSPTIQALVVKVDLRTLDSGAPERDAHVRQDSFEVSKYPYATLATSQATIAIAPGGYVEGQLVTFQLPGELTLHGVTRPVTFTMRGALSGDMISGSGTTTINIADYKMRQPETTSATPITISDIVGLSITLVAQAARCPGFA